eukprot:1156608-Pelagomonas_calceolata.AAC.10
MGLVQMGPSGWLFWHETWHRGPAWCFEGAVCGNWEHAGVWVPAGGNVLIFQGCVPSPARIGAAHGQLSSVLHFGDEHAGCVSGVLDGALKLQMRAF